MSSTAEPSQDGRPSGSDQSITEFLWRALNSLPVAVWVMVALAFFSALGTMIPQEHLARPEGGMSLAQMYESRFGPGRAELIQKLGLSRIYFTWYFNLLLAWLSVSAIVCNVVRFRRTVELWKKPPVKRRAALFTSSKRAVLATGVDKATYEAVTASLRSTGFRTAHEEDGNAACVYADRGFIHKWAMVALHASVLVLLFGGMYGKAIGVEDSVQLADGEKRDLTLDIVHNKVKLIQPLLEKLPPLTYAMDQSTYRIDYLKQIQLGSDILENVPESLQDYYRYIVHDYVSDLSVKRGKYEKRQEVKVNHPLVIDKLVLYQSGYQQNGYINISINGAEPFESGIMPDVFCAISSMGVVIQDSPGGPWLLPVEGTQFGRVSELPAGTPVSNMIFRFEAVKAGDVYEGGTKTGYIGPMTIVTAYDPNTGESQGSQLVTPEQPMTTMLAGQPVMFSMSKRVDNYSIFSYKRDPGIPILYFGWILMIVGISMALYIPFSQIWLRFEPEAGRLYLLGLGPLFHRNGRGSAKLGALLEGADISPAHAAKK